MQRIKVFHASSAWGGGHVQTCINLLKGMKKAGLDVHLDLPRTRVDMGSVPYRTTVSGPISRFDFRQFEPLLVKRAEARFLSSLREDEIAWIWPAASLDLYHQVADRGIPIMMEGINTRIANARRILEPIHAAEGVEPPYDISAGLPETPENEMLRLSSYFFAPNPLVVEAVEAGDSPFAGIVMPTSYGAWFRDGRWVDRSDRTGPLSVLFVGSVCIRKNAQGLLRAWAKLAPKNAKLILCGRVDDQIAKVCEKELMLPSVEVRGHVVDVASAYSEADLFVMPSFEEGGPQVTFEAATFGLPLITSPMGDGGISAEDRGTAWPIDPYDVDSIANAIDRFLSDRALCGEYGARSFEIAPRFDWDEVGRQRAESLRALN
jgi:glycosyltransferase involved in cell wall biosynthesis